MVKPIVSRIALFSILALEISGCGLADINREVAESSYNSTNGSTATSDIPVIASRTAIVFDRSGSFVDYLPQAVSIVKSYMRDNGISGDSEVLLIGMGHQPEVLQRMSAGSFLTQNARAMIDTLEKPLPGTGTDVVSAIEFAAHRLQENRSARADRLYCLVFSDMYVDDATTPAGVIHYRPLASADWGLLKGISTSFYFVAPANHDAIVGIGARNGLNFTVFEPREVTGADVKRATGGF